MIGRLIDGRYQVRSRIARGGMATVYLATDLRLERRVAIKIMHGHLAEEGNFKERFVQEARSAARLAHPNVVNVFDQGQDSDMAYLVMEYLPGMTLRDLLKDYGTLTTEQTLDIMDAVLGGLAAAHKAGIVHRDLKPENVLLADDGRIKIGDFGLSRATSANTATGQALLGTIAYLSPELLTRGVADARSDIYAAGIMMYEMLAGEQPFTGEQPMQIAFQHANETVPRPSEKNPTVPLEVDDLVLWATSREPDKRPDDARVMLEQLRRTEQKLGALQAAETGVQRTVVMPAAVSPMLSNAQTQILAPPRPDNPRSSMTTGPTAPQTPADRLVTASAKRRRRGLWLVGIIVLLAALAAGTGWYFGWGPGAQVVVPTLTGQTQESAQAALTAIGLKGAPEPKPDVAAPVGTVVGSSPGAHSHVAKDSSVTIYVSSGPAMLPLPELIGSDEATATAALTAAKFTVATSQSIFHAEDAGTVLDALNTDGASLATNGATAGATYPEGQAVTLIVSLGPVPDVSGQSLDDATATLAGVQLAAAEGEHDYNDSVPEGAVISASPTTDPVRPGDSITLTISRGPAPVPVPDVVGKTWADAKAALQAAGFDLKYPAAADIVPGLVTVTATDPAAGTQVKKGSSVTVSLTL
jgi:beta-lactam-binding protein with PASTA domain/tRNA A-37 threonylcarbamoyl transferase component Bud32